jgi:hypothetical protein
MLILHLNFIHIHPQKTKDMKNLYLTLTFLALVSYSFSQNEFVNDGGTVTVQSNALLYVKGQVIHTSTVGGGMTNNGLIQINTNNSGAGGGVWQWDLATPMTGNGKVLFEGDGDGEIKSTQANPDIKFATLEINVGSGVIVGNPPTNPAFVTVSKSFKTDSIRLVNGRFITGANEVHLTNTRPNAIQGTFGANQSNYIEGKLRRDIASGVAGTYKFPIGSNPITGEGYNLSEIEASTAPGGSLLGQFIDYTTPPAFNNFFQALTDCTPSPYNSPVWNQWIELSEMVPNYGLWRFEPTNGSGWNYNFIGTPNPLKVADNFSNYVNIKLVKVPTNYSFSNDWSQFVTASGNLCDGVNVDIDKFRDYNQGIVTNIYARSLNSFSDFGASGGGSSGLPVELISLRADPINNKFIKVSWATATEINNAGFEVMKSEDAVNFTDIGWVAGAGNSSVQNNYFLDDHNVVPNKVYYYRLRQVDFDGHSELTYIVSAMITAENVFIISEFMPNPANNTTSLVITSGNTRDIDVTFYNTLGQRIYSKSLVVEKGNNHFDFDLSDFAAGTYHSLITAGEHNFNKKIIITR